MEKSSSTSRIKSIFKKKTCPKPKRSPNKSIMPNKKIHKMKNKRPDRSKESRAKWKNHYFRTSWSSEISRKSLSLNSTKWNHSSSKTCQTSWENIKWEREKGSGVRGTLSNKNHTNLIKLVKNRMKIVKSHNRNT